MNTTDNHENFTLKTLSKTRSEELLEFSVGCIAKLEYCGEAGTQIPDSEIPDPDSQSVGFVRWTLFEKAPPARSPLRQGDPGAFLLSGLGFDREQVIRDMIVLLATLPAFLTSLI